MRENTEDLKNGIKSFLEKIGDDESGRQIIKLIYGFALSGYREYRAGNGGAE